MQINKTAQGGTVTWDYDDFTSGLIPQGTAYGSLTTGSKYPLKYNGINGFARAFNVDQDILNGTLAQGFAPNTNATNSNLINGNIVSANVITNGLSIGLDTKGYIHYITNVGASITVASTYTNPTTGFPHPITFATGGVVLGGKDTIFYRHNLGGTRINSVFCSAYNANNWNVAIATNSGFSVFEDNFMSNTPATPMDITTAGADGKDYTQINAPHPMEIGADAILYIGSGRYLHAYDGNTGSNGTFYSKVLTLSEGTVIVGMRKFQDSLLIATNFNPNYLVYGATSLDFSVGSTAAFVYRWNYLDLDVSSVIDTEEVEISAITVWKGNPVFVASGVAEANGAYKLKVISGNSVLTLASFDGGLPPNRGIITSTTAMYMNCPFGLYRVGSKFKPGYMISRYSSRTATYDYPGAFILSGDLLISSGSTTNTSSGVAWYSVNVNSYDTAFCKFPNLGNLFPAGKKGRIKYVEIEYQAPVAGSGGMSLYINTDSANDNNVSVATATVLSAVTTITAPLIKRYYKDTSGNPLPTFSNFDISVAWAAGTGPVISRMMIEYELLEITN